MNCFDIESYPDEQGFRRRVAGTVPALAAQPYGQRSLATSVCPDSGLPVRVWAVEGESIVSPYTGRRYVQGDTGYFGPKARDAAGRIVRFGGDALKYDLPPVTARLLLQPGDAAARAFVAIPGNLNQQYHFAAANWARFYGLLGDRMTPAWREAFAAAVADYHETHYPSDGAAGAGRAPRSRHDLVGEPGHVLGGDPDDGGTENHKTQWRTSGLLYARWFGPEGRISGHPAPVAAALIQERLADFLGRLALTGNGEYDSTIYHVYTLQGYLNLYDFSPDPGDRHIARLTLDALIATYGLKLFDGCLAGPSKRGGGAATSGSDRFMRLYATRGADGQDPEPAATLHQATTRYRPNRVITNILSKNVPLPFEARIARPSYHMDRANVAQETFYCHRDFALGSVALGELDNPGQQTVWSLVARGDRGAHVLGGGQPNGGGIMGHSPHDQVLQHRATLVFMSGPNDRAGGDWRELPAGLPADERWECRKAAAETWFYVPHGCALHRTDWGVIIEAGSVLVGLRCLGGTWFPLAEARRSGELQQLQQSFQVLVLPGVRTGFVLEAVGRSEGGTVAGVMQALGEPGRLDISRWRDQGVVRYQTLAGVTLEACYRRDRLKCEGSIGGEPVAWERWAAGGVYDSPYIRIGKGEMVFTDGTEGYAVRRESGVFGIGEA